MNRILKTVDCLGLLLALTGLVTGSLVAQPSKRVNVILISLDQLRADQLHCYGNPRATSPNIDRLAERGVRFSHFYTVASWTSPSYGSLMTSLYPSRHGVTLFWRQGDPLVDPKIPMLAQIFKAQGYHTAAFVNNGLAGKDLTGRGFDEYYQGQPSAEVKNITQRGGGPVNLAPETTQKILPWLARHQSQPFFLFVLFLEPHSPYNPPPKDDLFKTNAYPDQTNTGYNIKTGHLFRLAMLGDQQAIERLYQLYDGKIHFVDRYVGELMDQVKRLGLSDKTLIVLTSDHGELLYSHPRDFLTFDHRSLYDADVRIPLIIAGPGLPHGRVIDGLASNIDTAPTILNLTGLPRLPDAEGHSLVPLIKGKVEAVNKYVFSEEDVMVPLRSIRTPHYKLIDNLWRGNLQLFNLDDDPAELYNVFGHDPAVQNELLGRLKQWMTTNHATLQDRVPRWRKYASDSANRVVVTDDQTVGGRLLLTGSGWHSDEIPQSDNYQGGCFWTEGGNGSRTAVWRASNPLIGTYQVFIYYGHPAVGPLATNAPFTIGTNSGTRTVRVDFSKGAGTWNLLGTFKDPRYVSMSNAANGVVLVDAVRFERIGD